MHIGDGKTVETERYGKYSGTLLPEYDDHFNHEHIETMTSCIISARKKKDKEHGTEGEIIEKMWESMRLGRDIDTSDQ